jgi:hypothetical protein
MYTRPVHRFPDNKGPQISGRDIRKGSLKFSYGCPARAGQHDFSLHDDPLLFLKN